MARCHPLVFLSPLGQLDVFASCVCHNLKEADCLREAAESARPLSWFLLAAGKMAERESDVIQLQRTGPLQIRTDTRVRGL